MAVLGVRVLVGPPTAVLDANVLYPQFLRDVLLRLAAADLFAPRWTDRIRDEWTRNLLRDRPDLTPERLANTHRLMARAFPEARVAGYAHLEARVGGVHAKDRHVAAAALASGATHIVTWNMRDFPAEALAPHGVEAADPDAFVSALLDWAGRRGTCPRPSPGQHLARELPRVPTRQRLTRGERRVVRQRLRELDVVRAHVLGGVAV